MIFHFTLLYDAWRKTVVQSSEQTNKARLKYYLVLQLLKLCKELNNGTFQPRGFRYRNVYIPKERLVQVPMIRDKIVQHAICDNYLNLVLTKPLIKETSACLIGRGTQYGSKILKSQLYNYFTHYGKDFYVLKCDIKSYFATIPHDRLFELIDRYVDDLSVREIMKKFINQTDIGLALGLQQSQLLANLYLSGLDHYCKKNLKAKYYGRYMDDFYIISDRKDYLEHCLEEIDKYVQNIGLSLNPKTCIMKNKIEFIGFTYRITPKGKILKHLVSQKKKSKRRHIAKMLKQVKNGEMAVETMVNSYGCWRSHALQGNCYKLVRAWDEWIIGELKQLGYELRFNKMRWKLCQAQSHN